MENKDIRPCPFCGGVAKLEKNVRSACVVCTKCGAQSKLITIQIDICATDEAKRQWNRRVPVVRDDQGEGFSADDWYHKNFVEADAYKGEGTK